MVNSDRNSLNLNHLEEELELLLKQNLPQAKPQRSEDNSLKTTQETKQTLQQLAKQAGQPKVENKPKRSKPAPIVNSVNLNDTYIDNSQLSNIVPTEALEPELEPLEKNMFNNEEPRLSSALENFLNNHEEVEDDIQPVIERHISHDIINEDKPRITSTVRLIILGFLSLASAVTYYIYVYQPFAPSFIYADNSPYKTKNMVENLQNQTIVNSADLLNNTKTNDNNNLTVKQPFIKPIDTSKTKIAEQPETKLSPNDTKEVKKDKIVKTPNKTAIVVKDKTASDEPTLITAPKIENNDSSDAAIPTSNTKELPAILKLLENKSKDKPKEIKTSDAKKLDPWEANQLKKHKLEQNSLSDYNTNKVEKPTVSKAKPAKAEKTNLPKINNEEHIVEQHKAEKHKKSIGNQGKYYVQFASIPTISDASKLKNTYNDRYKDLLLDKSIALEKSKPINGHIYYRLRIRTKNMDEAKSLCLKVRDINGQCIFGKS